MLAPLKAALTVGAAFCVAGGGVVIGGGLEGTVGVGASGLHATVPARPATNNPESTAPLYMLNLTVIPKRPLPLSPIVGAAAAPRHLADIGEAVRGRLGSSSDR